MRQGLGKPWGVAAVAVALCATVALTMACGLRGGDEGAPDGTATPGVDATPTPDVPPEEALGRWVRNRLNVGFVSDCDDARRPDDVGKQCARVRGARNGMLAYELGPAFAEYTRLMILRRVGGDWTLAHLENRDPALPPVPGIPWPLEVGATVVVAGTGDCLRVRAQPGVQQELVDCLEDGTEATINAGPAERDGLQWWQLEGKGWSAGNWLRYPEEAAASSTATPPLEGD